ncbi:hypothetical protein ILYODFUR_032917 [Ilyodon furcidens]|uniref:Secreted protein n=1 Tax=Ilyodon furcidens TaxID=33524 RepID=A0ABV0U0C5_9TELE
MIKPIYALWISFPISCLCLDSHQAGSFLLPSSPGPNQQHARNLRRTHLHLTWILNLSSPGHQTTATYWSFDHYVPDYLPLR